MFSAPFDSYVDDPHLCVPLRPDDPQNPAALVNCLQDANRAFLKLNTSKAENPLSHPNLCSPLVLIKIYLLEMFDLHVQNTRKLDRNREL